MQDKKNVQLATALAAVLGFSLASAARAEGGSSAQFEVRENTLIAQAADDSVKLDENKGKEGSCKGKEGSCKGKEGKHKKGKEGSCKGKEGSCKGKEGSCKGKEGSCKGKEEAK
ncbi:MAG: hypothetical protein JSS83_11285 [Cyanobacteria bacterium SZAS LIN-3]|nr:hypothetical protein [Cyanobacteria bacterium SZAS LIN-3]